MVRRLAFRAVAWFLGVSIPTQAISAQVAGSLGTMGAALITGMVALIVAYKPHLIPFRRRKPPDTSDTPPTVGDPSVTKDALYERMIVERDQRIAHLERELERERRRRA